jgi:hypothetical protein
MNLYEAILGLYPNLVQGTDFLLQDDGQGAYIKSWTNPNPQPTQADLQRGWFEYNKRHKKQELALGLDAHVQAAYPDLAGMPQTVHHVTAMFDLDDNVTSVKSHMRTGINNYRAKVSQVNALTYPTNTVEQIKAITF